MTPRFVYVLYQYPEGPIHGVFASPELAKVYAETQASSLEWEPVGDQWGQDGWVETCWWGSINKMVIQE